MVWLVLASLAVAAVAARRTVRAFRGRPPRQVVDDGDCDRLGRTITVIMARK